ncbi:RNA-binding protein 39-like isoform X2 [Anneissia japonica]|uniref:RNA-binding protein 39-like isoform X2 n=1 Tax=Anneissia japonica TaxID=1529436 RepID=UPI0014257C8C|nr:RNA-binding protein 39-like isoform X2 [Anneissia japonica]
MFLNRQEGLIFETIASNGGLKKGDAASLSLVKKEESSRRRHASRSRSKSRDREKRHRSKSRDRDRKKTREHRRSRSRERRRSKSREHRRSRSRERRQSRSRERSRRDADNYDRPRRDRGEPERSRPFERDRGRERERESYRPERRERKERRSVSKERVKEVEPRAKSPELTPEQRDARTVFCMQLSARIRPRDLEEFFSAVGEVRDVRIISDRNSRRSKGVAYVEFKEEMSVPLAIGLNNQKLLGVPIIVQVSQAEKNRAANSNLTLQKGSTGPMRLYVGSLHFNITEDMLRGIFEPFGKIDNIQLIMDTETGRSKGYGFITFHDSEDAKKALEQLNGFELAGRPMKVGHVTERTDGQTASSFLDNDELERTGIEMTTTGRLQLMAKLAEGTGFQIPTAAAAALNPLAQMPGSGLPQLPGQQQAVPGAAPTQVNLQASLAAAQAQAQQHAAAISQQASPATPSITPSFMLSNMFDPNTESGANWDVDIRDDVIEECNKHGGCTHVYVDKGSPQGMVYVKCPTATTAQAAVNALHGRWFAGKMINAAYVPLANYHTIFPQSINSNQLLVTSQR